MADSGTIARYGGILKNVYGPKIVEQQNLTAFSRKRYGKADNDFYAGDHYEFPVRIGGNRAGVAAMASDDPLPTPKQQQDKKFLVFDKSYSAVYKVFGRDIANTVKNAGAFISAKQEEALGIARDILKVINIDLVAGAGSGERSTIAAGATSATQQLAVGTGTFQYGSRYLQVNDVIDIYDPTLTTSRTAGAGVSINAITPSAGGGSATMVLSASVTTSAGDIVINGKLGPNKAYNGFWGVTHNQGTTFQGLSTTTYPILNANRVIANGQPLTEGILRSLLDAIEIYSTSNDSIEFLASQAQFAAYEQLGFAQKRFTGSTMDKGFQKLEFSGHDFIKEVDVPPSAVYALDRSMVKFGEVKPMGWEDEDGSIIKWVPGYRAWTAFMTEDGQMYYERPNAIGVADTLSYPLSNPAYTR